MENRFYINNIEDIKPIKCDADSREITISKMHGENWSVYVSDNTMLTKLKNIMKTAPEGFIKCWTVGKPSDNYVSGYFFELNAKCIAFRSGNKKSKNLSLSEEEKAERKARFIERTRKAREEKKKLKEIK